MIDRVRTGFVVKLLAEIYPHPIKHVEEKLSFGRWVEQARETARISRYDIGIAMGKNEPFIEALETGTTQPWQLKTSELASLVALFKLHINAISDLVICSFAISNLRLSGNISARSHRGKMTSRRGSSTSRALDLFLANNASNSEPNDQVKDCLNRLRAELQQLGLNNLVE
jgi:hypothetical protein